MGSFSIWHRLVVMIIVVMVLVKLGTVDLNMLTNFRRYMIVSAFIIAAIVTPPDVFSQLMLALPLCLLYEIGLWVAKFVKPMNLSPA